LNDIDIFTNCCGFIAIGDGSGKLFGYNLTAGAAWAAARNAATFRDWRTSSAFLPPEKVVDVAKAVLTIHRDFGDRADRKHARLKYVLQDRGVQWFREELERRVGFRLAEPMPFRFEKQGDAFGWNSQVDGRLFLGLFIETGRIKDRDGWRMKTALREVVRKYQPEVRLTPANNVILANLDAAHREEITRLFAGTGFKPSASAKAASCAALSRWRACRCPLAAWDWRSRSVICRS